MTYVREAVATIPADHETYITSPCDGKPWHHAAYVKQKLEDHGFQGIEVNVVPNSTPFENVTAFVEQFSGILEQPQLIFGAERIAPGLVEESNQR